MALAWKGQGNNLCNQPTIVYLNVWSRSVVDRSKCGIVSYFVTKKANLLSYNNSLVQNCSKSVANALELLQSCTLNHRYIWNLGTMKNIYSKNILLNLRLTVWESKFLHHLLEKTCPLWYVIYKILLSEASFPLAQLRIYLHWLVGEH